jgi:phospholipid/cholesterol/gamma-HCH transport system substrate-binding protein
VALVVIAALILTSGSAATYTAKATFANVNGLVRTGNVEVAGFKIGDITDISVRIGGYPTVTMQISTSYRLRQGARAVIELGSLAGQLNRYIAISNGTGPVLPDGATIPLSHTDQPVEIDQFLSALDPKTRTELRNLLRDVVHALDHRGPDIERALQYSAQAFNQTANLLGDVAADGNSLGMLVTRAGQGAQALANEPADAQATIDQLSRLLQVTANRQTAVTQSLQRAPAAFTSLDASLRALDSSRPILTRLLSTADPALRAIDPFAHALRDIAPVSVPVFKTTLSLVSAFRQYSPAIQSLFAQPLPQTLHNLGTGLVGFNPVFDHLRARAPDVLGWIPLLGDVTSNFNASGHGWLVLAYPRPAPQRPIRSPTCASGWLLRPFDRVPGELACDPWLNYYKTFVGGGKPAASYPGKFQRQPYPGEFQ